MLSFLKGQCFFRCCPFFLFAFPGEIIVILKMVLVGVSCLPGIRRCLVALRILTLFVLKQVDPVISNIIARILISMHSGMFSKCKENSPCS